MHPHVWYVIAFLLLLAATVYSAATKTWALCLVAAGLACWVLPAAFQLGS
jgi:hypothetical protein